MRLSEQQSRILLALAAAPGGELAFEDLHGPVFEVLGLRGAAWQEACRGKTDDASAWEWWRANCDRASVNEERTRFHATVAAIGRRLGIDGWEFGPDEWAKVARRARYRRLSPSERASLSRSIRRLISVGAIERARPGRWRITDEGTRLARKHRQTIVVSDETERRK